MGVLRALKTTPVVAWRRSTKHRHRTADFAQVLRSADPKPRLWVFDFEAGWLQRRLGSAAQTESPILFRR